jgi:hypothetical protein
MKHLSQNTCKAGVSGFKSKRSRLCIMLAWSFLAMPWTYEVSASTASSDDDLFWVDPQCFGIVLALASVSVVFSPLCFRFIYPDQSIPAVVNAIGKWVLGSPVPSVSMLI